jgi:hypothetical protein
LASLLITQASRSFEEKSGSATKNRPDEGSKKKLKGTNHRAEEEWEEMETEKNADLYGGDGEAEFDIPAAAERAKNSQSAMKKALTQPQSQPQPTKTSESSSTADDVPEAPVVIKKIAKRVALSVD